MKSTIQSILLFCLLFLAKPNYGQVKDLGRGTLGNVSYASGIHYSDDVRARVSTISSSGAWKTTPVTSIAPFKFTNNQLLVYPNPASDRLSLKWKTEEKELYSVIVYDLSGKVLGTYEVTGKNGLTLKTIDISTFGQGLYLIEVRSPRILMRSLFSIH